MPATAHPRVGEPSPDERRRQKARLAAAEPAARAYSRDDYLRRIAESIERLSSIYLAAPEAAELRAHTKHICVGRLADAAFHLAQAAAILNPE